MCLYWLYTHIHNSTRKTPEFCDSNTIYSSPEATVMPCSHIAIARLCKPAIIIMSLASSATALQVIKVLGCATMNFGNGGCTGTFTLKWKCKKRLVEQLCLYKQLNDCLLRHARDSCSFVYTGSLVFILCVNDISLFVPSVCAYLFFIQWKFARNVF